LTRFAAVRDDKVLSPLSLVTTARAGLLATCQPSEQHRASIIVVHPTPSSRVPGRCGRTSRARRMSSGPRLWDECLANNGHRPGTVRLCRRLFDKRLRSVTDLERRRADLLDRCARLASSGLAA
jgi:hypothetical protein